MKLRQNTSKNINCKQIKDEVHCVSQTRIKKTLKKTHKEYYLNERLIAYKQMLELTSSARAAINSSSNTAKKILQIYITLINYWS